MESLARLKKSYNKSEQSDLMTTTSTLPEASAKEMNRPMNKVHPSLSESSMHVIASMSVLRDIARVDEAGRCTREKWNITKSLTCDK